MRRDPVVLAWVAGLGLAALIYFVGPDRFLFRLVDWLHVIGWRVSEFVADLSIMALDLVRALAIGLYATFLALGTAVARRGGRARGALVIVSVLFFLLANGALDGEIPNARWTAALLLAAAGSAVMTARLRHGNPVTLRQPGGARP